MQQLTLGTKTVCLSLLALMIVPSNLTADNDHDSARRTPLVEAVSGCRDSVVNLRGKKTITPGPLDAANEEARLVNGMGTGVVIDSRGYVLTNYHVVQDVKNIQVTTRDHQQCWATLIAHDPVTDLAIIKINVSYPLPEIRQGRSADLMLAETVAAVGNAYGYEHTVTTGIVSHLDRTVQVNDTQIYEHLIQTDASINPGNSGGPLLNLDGEMIGVNVAVRVGAQGIAFAIPVDKAIQVAADLIDNHTRNTVRHGLTVETRFDGNTPGVVIRSVAAASPAASAGLAVGDVIASIDGKPALRAVDFYRALLEQAPGRKLALSVLRSGTVEPLAVELTLEPAGSTAIAASFSSSDGDPLAWMPIGLKVVEIGEAQMSGRHPDYQRGLQVTEVRPGSPAFTEGIQPGDILVAMFGLKTESIDNLAYILDRPEIRRRDEFRFYILRQNETFRGQMRIADRSTALQPATTSGRTNR